MKLNQLLAPDHIALDLDVRDRKDVIARLVNLLAGTGQIQDADQVKSAVIRREEQVGTGIGYGVAIPHADPGPYPEPLAAFCRTRHGVDFHANDREPARLIFLLLTPDTLPALHVRLLARICRLLKSQKLRDALLKAASPADAARLIAEAEVDYPELTQ